MAIESSSGGARTARDGDVELREVLPAALLREREARLPWPHLYHLQRLAEGGLLAAGLAHDVGNLCSAIAGWCQIAASAAEPEARAQALEKARDLATRTAGKAKTFLTFARAYVPPPCRVALTEVVADAVGLARTARPGLEIRWRAPEGPVPMVLGPRTLLLQACLEALLRLSVPEAGRCRSLRVRAEARDRVARLEIEEYGPSLRDPVRLLAGEPVGAIPVPPAALALDPVPALVRDLGGRIGWEALVPRGVRVWVESPPLPTRSRTEDGAVIPAGVREAELVLDSARALEVAGPCEGLQPARTLLYRCGSAAIEVTVPAVAGPGGEVWLRGRHVDLRPGAPARVRVVLHGHGGPLSHASSSLRGDFAFAVPSEPIDWIEVAPRDGPPFRLLLPSPFGKVRGD